MFGSFVRIYNFLVKKSSPKNTLYKVKIIPDRLYQSKFDVRKYYKTSKASKKDCTTHNSS